MDKNIKRRSAYRGILTKRFKEFTDLIDNNSSLEELIIVADKAEDCWNTLKEISDLISDNLSEEEIEDDILTCDKYNNMFLSIRSKLKLLREEDRKGENHKIKSCAVNTKLPKLSIPFFSGDVLQWVEFWELFSTNIDENSSLSSVEKFSYLRSLIKGQAAAVINGFQLSSSNYSHAVDLLKRRYGCDSKIIKAHVKELLNLDPIKTTKNSCLRQLVDKITIHIRALEALGVAKDSYGCFLMQIILCRLPNSLKLNWARKDPEDNLNLEDLMEFLRNETLAIEVTCENNNNTNLPTKAVLITKRSSVECFNCRGDHYLSECSKFKSLNLPAKFNIIKDKQLCANCFGPRHSAANCHKSIRCNNCNQKHHTLLHKPDSDKPILKLDAFGKDAYLPTVELCCLGGKTPLVALLDSGSQLTLINKNVTTKINCNFENLNRSMNILGITNQTLTLKHPKVAKFSIMGKHKQVELSALIVEDLNLLVSVPTGPYSNTPVDIIIGVDMLGRILTGKLNSFEGIISFETICGWAHMGKSEASPPSRVLAITERGIDGCSNCEEIMTKVWSCDVGSDDNHNEKTKDVRAVELFDSSFCYDDSGRCVVSWPLKDSLNTMGSCEKQSFQRLLNLLKRLKSDKQLRSAYTEIIDDYLSRDIVEIVGIDSNSSVPSNNSVRYLPHHPVIKKTPLKTKVRVVFDASSRDEHGISLNSLMFTGPNLNPDICELLIRFRMHNVALVADVEKAFLQLSLEDKQRDLTRFFWINENDEIIKLRFKRVIFGVRASPFLLAAALRKHFGTQTEGLKDTAQFLTDHMYVDDLVASVPTEDDATKLKKNTITIFNQIKMNIRGWKSNKDSEPTSLTQVLGTDWDCSSDELVFRFPDFVRSPESMTKRQLLKFLASVWDPYGIFSSILLLGKIILRKFWILDFGWDDPAPLEIQSDLLTFSNAVKEMIEVRLPRHIGISLGDKVHLHAFADASKDGIGSVVYLCTPFERRFLIARAKLTPLRKVTIPRLELIAALQTAKLVDYVRTSLRIDCSITCWSDSKVVLYWIKSTPLKWKQFVANRTTSIRKLVAEDNWKFVPGDLNPADCLSRGKPTLEYLQPPPIESINDDNTLQEDTSEQQVPESKRVISVATVEENESDFLYTRNFSSFRRLISVIFLVLSFINKCRHPRSRADAISRKDAEAVLIRYIQRTAFKNDVVRIQNCKPLSNSSLIPLRPFVDSDGIMRADRRLLYSNLSYEEKYPIILPKEHHVVDLLIYHYHEKLFHSSTERTIVQLRLKYWIISCRVKVKSIINSCRGCKRFRVKSSDEDMPPLPDFRTALDNYQPFSHVGIDFTGPLHVNLVGQNKVYVLLITCAKIRAVHLEVTTSMDTHSCLNALKRFISRRGAPSLIVSDNAKTFIAVSKLIITEYNCTWNFITPRAPWHGGFYERLNKSLKDPLRFAVAKGSIQLQDFLTIISQIEALINSRPLTSIKDDISDEFVLTPAHFLVGKSLLAHNNIVKTNDCISLPKLWDGRKERLKVFWKVWQSRYLRELRQKGRKEKRNELKVGDIVLIGNEKNRKDWPLGRIKELVKGRDGKVRSVAVNCRGKVLVRPIQVIYLLEEDNSK